MNEILSLYTLSQIQLFIVNTTLFVIFGLMVTLVTIPKVQRDILTDQNADGFILMIVGVLGMVLGFIIPDYASAYALSAIGMSLLVYGILIAIPNGLTDFLFSKFNGYIQTFVYLFGATSAYLYGIRGDTGTIAVVAPFMTFWLGGMAGIGAVFATLLALTCGTSAFRQRVLPMNGLGMQLIIRSFVFLGITLFAGANAALLTATAALGAFLCTLGALIAAREETTDKLLALKRIPLWLGLMTVLFILARFGVSFLI